VDQRNCQRSLENGLNHFEIATALGVSPELSAEDNMAMLRRVLGDRPEDAEHRSRVLRKMRAQSMEFSELNIEYGHAYDSAAVVPDRSPAPEPVDDVRVYAPSTRPARRCRTPGSTTRTAIAARSRTSSPPGGSC
jgi:2,4-dichlorophenol 6-monooxygenase